MLSADIHDPFSLAQIIGYLAAVIGIVGFAQHDDTRMRVLIFLMGCVIVVHFILLGAYVAALSAGLAGARAGLSVFPIIRQRYAHPIAAICVFLAVCIGVLLYERPIDILPFIAALTGTYAFFYCEGIKMRLVLLFGTLLWLTHNVLALSYGPSIMEFMIFCSNARTIYQMLKKKGPSKPL